MADAPRRRERDRHYDRHQRDQVARKFYKSKSWERARTRKLSKNPLCERCLRTFARHVHHRKPLDQCTVAERTAQANLMAVCPACHNAIEAEAARQDGKAADKALAFVHGILDVQPDPRFWYDAAAADKAVRFFARFLTHYEGKHAGEPFALTWWQEDITRKAFGWKWKGTNRRRFTEIYIIAAKGAGKTPWMAGLGLYAGLADGEAAPHVISFAADYTQAKFTLDFGRGFVMESPDLSRVGGVKVQERQIKLPSNGKWTVLSGRPKGRSGMRPSAILADELHEWQEHTAKAFDILTANLFKRSQPLLVMVTNAAENRTCYAWKVHERARAAMLDSAADPSILPAIFEADAALDWRSEQAAAQANPSLGTIVQFSDILPEQAKGERRYRRLYLSQWVTGSEKWLDMNEWDVVASEPLPDSVTAGRDLYVGIDLSLGNDLCAVVYVYALDDGFAVRSSFWLPKKTANLYQVKSGHPYAAWAARGDVYLLDDDTISTAVQERIADEIIATHRVQPVKLACYDHVYSSQTVARLKGAGIATEGIRQGWSVHTGTAELERRITERSIVIEPNAVLRFCAENAEVKGDEHGNQWPVKPNAKDKYAGLRSAKIDGISALVTALTRAREHTFPTDRKVWRGKVQVL